VTQESSNYDKLYIFTLDGAAKFFVAQMVSAVAWLKAEPNSPEGGTFIDQGCRCAK
jgi:hypothetical protein